LLLSPLQQRPLRLASGPASASAAAAAGAVGRGDWACGWRTFRATGWAVVRPSRTAPATVVRSALRGSQRHRSRAVPTPILSASSALFPRFRSPCTSWGPAPLLLPPRRDALGGPSPARPVPRSCPRFRSACASW